MVPSHWSNVGESSCKHFLVIDFLLLAKSIFNKYLSFCKTVYGILPRYKVTKAKSKSTPIFLFISVAPSLQNRACERSEARSGAGSRAGSRACEMSSERRAGFNPEARVLVPFCSISVPIPLSTTLKHAQVHTDSRVPSRVSLHQRSFVERWSL